MPRGTKTLSKKGRLFYDLGEVWRKTETFISEEKLSSLKVNKQRGGRIWPHSQMQPFCNVLDECGFMDLGFVGTQYTWHKNFAGYIVWERLDRAVATNEWFSLFPGTKVHHLKVTISDHKPLWISPDGMDCKMKKPFLFEKMWMTDEGCSRTVEVVWKEDSDEPWGTRVIKKVEKCGRELKSWSGKSFGNVRREIEKKQKHLVQVEVQAIRGGNPNRVRQLERDINLLMYKKAKMWAQRSRVLWLKDGDNNTRFFHSKASQRRQKNYITGLFDDSGSWTTQPTRISTTVMIFY